MARKKVAETSEEEAYSGGLHKDLVDQYGLYITNGIDLSNEEEIIIPVSPALDVGLNGGIVPGRWIVINGGPKIGKTVTALQIAARCQKSEQLKEFTVDGNVQVFYHDIEHRLSKKHLNACKGLEVEHFHHFASKRNKILVAEEQLDFIERSIKLHPGSVQIIDSFGALATRVGLAEDIEKQQRCDVNKLVTKFVERVQAVVPVNKTILIGMTRNYSNPSGYGASSVEKTTTAVKHQCDIKLKAKGFIPWVEGNRQVGQIIDWKIEYSALGGPGAEVKGYLRYGAGIDEVAELFHLGVELGLITKSGKWVSFEFVRQTLGNEAADKSFDGAEKATAFLSENEEYQTLLHQCIMGMM